MKPRRAASRVPRAQFPRASEFLHAVVWHTLNDCGTLTVSQIHTETGLSPTTIEFIVNDLVRRRRVKQSKTMHCTLRR
jgi:DNA-binding IclR family transcriptional regulator